MFPMTIFTWWRYHIVLLCYGLKENLFSINSNPYYRSTFVKILFGCQRLEISCLAGRFFLVPKDLTVLTPVSDVSLSKYFLANFAIVLHFRILRAFYNSFCHQCDHCSFYVLTSWIFKLSFYKPNHIVCQANYTTIYWEFPGKFRGSDENRSHKVHGWSTGGQKPKHKAMVRNIWL